MVKFQLISYKDGVYHYEYYPNGDKNEKGSFKFNPEQKKLIEHIESPNGWDAFFNKAVSGLRDEDGNYKESGMVAWY